VVDHCRLRGLAVGVPRALLESEHDDSEQEGDFRKEKRKQSHSWLEAYYDFVAMQGLYAQHLGEKAKESKVPHFPPDCGD
jgi:hypothetical protein